MSPKGDRPDEPAKDAAESKPNDEVTSEEETVHRTTFRGSAWKVRLSDEQLEKFVALKADQRFAFLAPRLRQIADRLPFPERLGQSLDADYRRILRKIEGGAVEGSRGTTLERHGGRT